MGKVPIGRTLIVFLLCVTLTHSCEQTFSNTNVTLVGAKDVKTITGCFSPTEDLIKVSYIQIINETVPVLKEGAFNGLPNLVDIILDSDGITNIESGCFTDLPKLYLIKLRYNNFSTIREGVFNGLTVSELCLTENNIESVHPKAFNNIPNLSIVLLDKNKIAYWSSDWFLGSPKIAVLNFKENLITNIPSRAFKNINGRHYDQSVKLNISTNIFLNNNRIRYISDKAFEGIQIIGWLFLQKNEIEEINEESLGSLTAVDWIRLDHNKLKCIPEKLVQICAKVVYYLGNNPLTEECRNKFEMIKNGNSTK